MCLLSPAAYQLKSLNAVKPKIAGGISPPVFLYLISSSSSWNPCRTWSNTSFSLQQWLDFHKETALLWINRKTAFPAKIVILEATVLLHEHSGNVFCCFFNMPENSKPKNRAGVLGCKGECWYSEHKKKPHGMESGYKFHVKEGKNVFWESVAQPQSSNH